jgi:hypothetical protein
MNRHPQHAPKRTLRVLASVGAVLALGSLPASGLARPPATELTIRVWNRPVPAPPARIYRLACAPAGGTLPHPARACAALAAAPKLLAPPRSCRAVDVVRATVTGTLRRAPLRRTYLGCPSELAAWRALAARLGIAAVPR